MNLLLKTSISAVALTVLASAAPANAGSMPALDVWCADGTKYTLTSDAISAEVACAKHGGLMPKHRIPASGGVKANVGTTPAIPDRQSNARKSRVSR